MHWYSESKNLIFQSFETYAPITEEKNFQQKNILQGKKFCIHETLR